MNPLRELKYNLGQLDALIAFNELLLIEYNRVMSNSDEILNKMAKMNNIRVDSFDYNSLKKLIYRSHIVNIHSHFEIFLIRIIDKAGLYTKLWKKKDDKEDRLKSVYNNVFQPNERRKANGLKQLCDYYRLIRNKIVHQTKDEITFNYHNFACEDDLQQIVHEFLPNNFDNISYCDCILYTRAIKLLAEIISSHLRYDVQKIIENFDINRVVSSKRIDKKRTSIKTQLRMEFNLDQTSMEFVIDEIMNKLG